jgi:hypothetical protein
MIGASLCGCHLHGQACYLLRPAIASHRKAHASSAASGSSARRGAADLVVDAGADAPAPPLVVELAPGDTERDETFGPVEAWSYADARVTKKASRSNAVVPNSLLTGSAMLATVTGHRGQLRPIGRANRATHCCAATN